MPLGAFALVNRRWRPSNIVYKEYEDYSQLVRFMPKEIFEARMKTITRLILKEFPHICVDSHLFVLALAMVIAAAVFAIAARALAIAMWYPLCILIVPAIIAYWTTRRRGLQYIKMSQFHDKLQDCLKKLTMMDAAYQIRWSYRRLELLDSRESLGLKYALDRQAIALVIEVTPIEYNNTTMCSTRNSNNNNNDRHQQQRRSESVLPTYESIEQDLVLDVGPAPAMREITVSIPPPVYTSSRQQQQQQHEEASLLRNSTPPPPYHHSTTL
ncbi:hypothetical protein BDA99DRAFT_336167 [Phascolomyces articulosus]|uniref:Uncharacterized protein n=1 Tax=Phascolomyces articulosus TaxID=60185 RepID=A0AAD5K497_9FUNG|nr:hypothetical protein BDA99DRAFT_336167 [Phascolomyces articulosus]